jgi:superfamily II DNA or RNA helicase
MNPFPMKVRGKITGVISIIKSQEDFNKSTEGLDIIEMNCSIPKALSSRYKLNLEAFLQYQSECRNHQLGALSAIKRNSVGQIILPTGTGKTRIQLMIHLTEMLEYMDNHKRGVFVIGCHRLILCQQLLKNLVDLLVKTGMSFDILQVNSEQNNGSDLFLEHQDVGFDSRVCNFTSTTNSDDVRIAYDKAIQKDRNLIVVSTYHSFGCLNALEKIDIITYDEAHTIADNDQFMNSINRSRFLSKKNYFFTATQKVVNKTEGMADKNFFGDIIYSRSPKEMIDAGEIVKPILHMIKLNDPDILMFEPNSNKMKMKTIMDGFSQHVENLSRIGNQDCKIGAKILVAMNSIEDLIAIIKHNEFKQWALDNYINIFAFTSSEGCFYNFDFISRNEIHKKMNELSNDEKSIFFHFDILSEGIDLPNLTGIILLREMSRIKLIQTIGRATRLFREDRMKLYSGNIKHFEYSKFIKPYAHIMIPEYFENMKNIEMLKGTVKDIYNTYGLSKEDFANLDKSTANNSRLLKPLTTNKDKANFGSEVVGLIHILESIRLDNVNEMIHNLNEDDFFNFVHQI